MDNKKKQYDGETGREDGDTNDQINQSRQHGNLLFWLIIVILLLTISKTVAIVSIKVHHLCPQKHYQIITVPLRSLIL